MSRKGENIFKRKDGRWAGRYKQIEGDQGILKSSLSRRQEQLLFRHQGHKQTFSRSQEYMKPGTKQFCAIMYRTGN